jgi:hypothetical protein
MGLSLPPDLEESIDKIWPHLYDMATEGWLDMGIDALLPDIGKHVKGMKRRDCVLLQTDKPVAGSSILQAEPTQSPQSEQCSDSKPDVTHLTRSMCQQRCTEASGRPKVRRKDKKSIRKRKARKVSSTCEQYLSDCLMRRVAADCEPVHFSPQHPQSTSIPRRARLTSMP